MTDPRRHRPPPLLRLSRYDFCDRRSRLKWITYWREENLSEQEKISPIIRVVSGVIGILGFGAIAFNAVQVGGLKPGLMLFASFFAGFIFLFVALFGKYPWDRAERSD